MFDFNSINCLFTSDILVDKDIGLIKLISKKFTKCDDYFYKDIINIIVKKENCGKYMLYQRKEYNPLTVISKENVSDNILDSLYGEFMEKCYDEIIDLSIPSDLMEMVVQSGYTHGVIRSTVLCSSKHEEEAIQTFFSSINVTINTIVSSIDEIDVDDFDAICIKNYIDLYRFKPFHGKTVIVSSGEYNYTTIEEAGFHELNPIISIYLCNNDNELSKIEMYRTLDIDDSVLLNNNEDEGDM